MCEILWSATKLSLRLLETLETSLVGFLAPWQMRRKGRAKLDLQRDRQLLAAQTKWDIEDIKHGRKQFTLDYRLVDSPQDETGPGDYDTSGTFAAMAQHNLLVERMGTELNVRKALLNAATALGGDEQEPPDRRVDNDWLLRWRESAGRVSSEKLQDLWGRVLAGEVKSPGSFSLRTLAFLRTLSQEEALRIEAIAPFVIDNNFIVKEQLYSVTGCGTDFLQCKWAEMDRAAGEVAA